MYGEDGKVGGGGTKNPVVSLVIAALTKTETIGVNHFLEFIILQSEPFLSHFHQTLHKIVKEPPF